MRKLLATILLVGVLGFMAVPALVGAADIPTNCDASAHEDQLTDILESNDYPNANNWSDAEGIVCLLDTVITIQTYLFYIILGGAMILLLVGAFQFLTAGGSEDQTESARNTLVYALAGVAAAYLARFALQLVMNLMS